MKTRITARVRHWLIAALLLAAVASSMACAELEDTTDSPGRDVSGSYNLKQVNGQDLPAGTGTRLVIDGNFDLTADGAWSLRISFRGNLGFSRVNGDDGMFSKQGNTLTFQTNSGDTFTGQLSGGRLTVRYDYGEGKPEQFVFAK